MATQQTGSFGSWTFPISADAAVGDFAGLLDAAVRGRWKGRTQKQDQLVGVVCAHRRRAGEGR
jgi:hypothetical protein